MSIEQHYYPLRGDGYLRRKGTVVYRPVGNLGATAITLAQTETEEISTGNIAGLLSTDVLTRSATIALILKSQSLENSAIGLVSTVNTVPASTVALNFDLPALKAGEVHKLPYVNLTSVVIGTLVAGTDYRVTAKGGFITAMRDCPATAGGTYQHTGSKILGLFIGAQDEFQLMFYSERSGRTYEVLTIKFTPGQHDLISDQNGQITLSGKLLLDTTIDGSDLPAELKALGGYVRIAQA